MYWWAPSRGLEAGPERPLGVVHAGLDRANRDPDPDRDLGQRQFEVVVEDQYGTLFDGEPSERPFKLVSMFDIQVLIGPVHGLDGKQSDDLGPSRATP